MQTLWQQKASSQPASACATKQLNGASGIAGLPQVQPSPSHSGNAVAARVQK